MMQNYFNPSLEKNILLQESLKVVINNFLVEQYSLAAQYQDNSYMDLLESFAINGGGFNIYTNVFRAIEGVNGNFVTINFLSDNVGSSTVAGKHKAVNFEILVFTQSQDKKTSLQQQELSSKICLMMLNLIERSLDYQLNIQLNQDLGVVLNSTKVENIKLNNSLDLDSSVVYNVGSLDCEVKYFYEKSKISGLTIEEINLKMNDINFSTKHDSFVSLGKKETPALNVENRFLLDLSPYGDYQWIYFNLSYVVNGLYFDSSLRISKGTLFLLNGGTLDVEYVLISSTPLNNKSVSCRITYDKNTSEVIFYIEETGGVFINVLEAGTYIGTVY